MTLAHAKDSTTSAHAGVVFVHDQDAPAEWTAALRAISPISDDRGWLELVWEPGDFWDPVQRWELYEMVHPSFIDPVELLHLRGKSPRATGHPCTSVPLSSWAVRTRIDYKPCLCEEKTEAWRDSESLVTLTEWKLFRRTGYVGRPFWVIQGTTGGHKVGFTHEEGLLLEAEGYPTNPPRGGSLAFAPFDQRVVRQISRFNRLWQFKNNIEEYRDAMGPGFEKYRSEVNKELRKQLVAHLTEQMRDVATDFLAADDAGEFANVARTEIDYDRLDQMNDEHFIETGKILHHSKI